MKVFLYIVGWISCTLALFTLGEAESAVGQGVAAAIWVAAVVAIGAGAICGRLDRLTEKTEKKPPQADAFDRNLSELAAQARAERSPANTPR